MAKSAQPKTDASAGADEAPSYPGLKTAVIVMGVLLVAGFIIVFATIIYRAANLGTDRSPNEAGAAAAFQTVESLIPNGAVIGAMSLDGNRLAVQIVAESGTEIIMFDVRRGVETGRIRLSPR